MQRIKKVKHHTHYVYLVYAVRTDDLKSTNNYFNLNSKLRDCYMSV